MARLFILFLLAAQLSVKAFAAGEDANVVAFEGVQEHCVQVGDITFGAGGRWANCHVTRGRWVATIELVDIYQAQYCLGNDAQTCDKKALVLFGNRAYTKDANVLLMRIDAASTEYDDPLVVILGDERVMSVSAHNAAEVANKYYLWRTDHWQAMAPHDWQHDLATKLPAGKSLRQPVWPDLESMSAQAKLFLEKDADCCPTGGLANVDFDLVKEQFFVKKVHLSL